MRRPRFHFLLLAMSATLLVSCAETSQDSMTTTSDANAPSSEPSQSTAQSDAPEGTAPVSTPPSDETRLMTDVRVTPKADGDRIVFEFAGATPPGYVIEYVDPPILSDGSGDPVALPGEAVISARFVHSSTVELTSGVSRSYTGDARFTPDGATNITEVARVGDFEAQLTWGIGMKERIPFKVTDMTGPARVVIDFRRP